MNRSLSPNRAFRGLRERWANAPDSLRVLLPTIVLTFGVAFVVSVALVRPFDIGWYAGEFALTLVFLAVGWWAASRAAFTRVLWILMAAWVWIVGSVLWTFVQNALVGAANRRVTIHFSDAVTLGLTVAFLTVVIVAVWRVRHAWLWYALGFVAVFPTGTRSALAALLVGMLVTELLRHPWSKRQALQFAGVVAVIGGIGAVLLWAPGVSQLPALDMLDRYRNFDRLLGHDWDRRMEAAAGGWELFRRSPLVGFGLEAWKSQTVYVWEALGYGYVDAHNAFAHYLGTGGMVAGAVMLVPPAVALAFTRRTWRRALPLAVAIVSVNVFDVTWFFIAMYATLWTGLGFLLAGEHHGRLPRVPLLGRQDSSERLQGASRAAATVPPASMTASVNQ